MLMRPLLLSLTILILSACSSSGGRAPVSDLSLGVNSTDSFRATTQKGAITGKIYTVQKGDTLYSIGWRSGVAVSKLVSLNNINKSHLINIGQRLKLTEKSISPSKKIVKKRDPSPQNENKNSTFTCITQNCQKNTLKRVDQEKTKAYSKVKPDKERSNKKTGIVKLGENNNNKVDDWSWPINGKLTKRFSASPSGMQGISLVNKQGSLIRATAAGQVVYAGSGLRGYGNLIIIKHSYDYLSAYAHNETLLVRENDSIKKGQKIATMGDSGTDHVHLHFEIRYRGKSVDPLRYLPKR